MNTYGQKIINMIKSITNLFTYKIQTTTNPLQIQSDLVWQLPESSSISFGFYFNLFEDIQHIKKWLKQHIILHAYKPSTNHKQIWRNWVSNYSSKQHYKSPQPTYMFCSYLLYHFSSGQCIVETLYNTSCIADKLNGTQSIQENEINSCLIDKDAGYG